MTYYIAATELDLPAGVTLTPTSSPFTLDAVASAIFEFESDVDGYAAAAGYAVPVSTAATYAFGSMRRAVRNGVTAFVLQTIFPNMGGPADKTSTAAAYQAAYDNFRKALKDGSLALVGAAMADGGTGGARAVPVTGRVSAPLTGREQF